MRGSSMLLAGGLSVVLIATAGFRSPAAAAAVGDEEARKLVVQMMEGRIGARPGGWSVQYAPLKSSLALGDARRVTVQNLSYGYKDYRIKVGDVAVLVEPPDPATAVEGLGSIYPVSFRLPDSVTLLEKARPLGSVSIGYSTIAGRFAPQVRAFLTMESDFRALTLTGVKGVSGSLAGFRARQTSHGSADRWSAEQVFSLGGLRVAAQDVVFGVEEISQTSTVDGFPLLPWFETMNRLMAIIPQNPEKQTSAQNEAMGGDVLALLLKAPPVGDHLGTEMTVRGISMAHDDIKGSIGRIAFGMGYDAVATTSPPAGDAAAEPEGPVALGNYRLGFAIAGLAPPREILTATLGASIGEFVGHTVPTDLSLKIDLANVPTRALLMLADRANAGAIARSHKDPISDAPDDTPAKVAGEAWILLKRVKTGLRTGFDIASDMVKIGSLSDYVADASQPSGQVNATRITVAGLDALLAAYKAPDAKPAPKPAPGAKKAAPPADDEWSTILNYTLLGVRFVKGVGNPRVADGAIVYDYLIETDQNGVTLVNGQDFVAMVKSFGKGMPDKM